MQIRKLAVPEVSPSTSFLVLRAAEVGNDSHVEYDAWGGNQRVRLRFRRLIGARMDSYLCEASSSPASVGEIVDSTWLRACCEIQARRHPDSPDTLAGVRHFFVKGHDTVVEVLAAECDLEAVPDHSG